MLPKNFKLKNGQRLIIREAERGDAKILLDFINYVAGETEFLTFGENEFFMRDAEFTEFIQKCEDTANMLMLVGDVEGEVAGNLTFRGGERQRVEHTGEFGITVAREYWGLGIGTRLIETLIAWAKESGVIRKINLRVHENNHRAIKLYHQLGFREEGLISREYLIGGNFYGNVFMGLPLDN
jgi:RimJ/RimL family protein N-acetyltransferase